MLIPLLELDPETAAFRTEPWPFQQTFKTPLPDLEAFVSRFIAAAKPERAVLHTDLVVFEPRELLNLQTAASLPIANQWKFTIEATGESSCSELLVAALGDWTDFTFVPQPAVFAIYADHDEFTTFYSRDKSALESLAIMLIDAGYKPIPDYVRGPATESWR